MPGDFYHQNFDVSTIIATATQIRKGSVIRVESDRSDITTRYALHNAFDGAQRGAIEFMESKRAILSCLGSLSQLVGLLSFPDPCTCKMILVINSDKESKGMNLGFGVDRFDSHMGMIVGEALSSWQCIRTMISCMAGTLAKAFHAKEKPLPFGLQVKICNSYDFSSSDGNDEYTFLFDGSQGRKVSMRVISEAIPYCTCPK